VRKPDQPVGDGVRPLLSGVPGDEYRAGTVGPGEFDRRAGIDHDHRARVGLNDRFDELALAARERQVAAVGPFGLP
jgi:hypothetical protein